METEAWVGKQGGLAAALVVLLVLVFAQWMAPSLAEAQNAGAPQPTTEPPPGYAGSEACIECHKDPAATFAKTVHHKLFLKHPRTDKERLGCEACHGPGLAHGEAEGKTLDGLKTFGKKSPLSVAEQNAICLECHQKTARLYWQGGPHESRDLACTDCHKIMEAVSERRQLAKATVIETCSQCHIQRRAQLMRSSHMPLREGKMDCVSCHNPHGTATEKQLKANSVNEVCYTCHAEKRGPFLWEHPPVTESCSNCHDPHGSNHEKLLKVAKPRLCQQCHVESRHPTRPHDPFTRFVFNRSCTNCHSQIHGSNHPSAAGRFQR